MRLDRLRIVTRRSPLALWQAEHVRARLQQIHPGLAVELIGIQTRGDRILDAPLARVGGKGLFVKELETRLLEGGADLAVHSMKDVPATLPPGLALPVVLEREDPRDALLSPGCADVDELPQGAVVGTASLRRQCQLQARRPDLRIRSLRGNVGTRLRKLDEGEFDAIVLAAAGVKRLGLAERVRQFLPPEVILPAIGQGAIGIECREGERSVLDLIRPLDHAPTHRRVDAERTVNRRLYGDCQVPLAAYAELNGERMRLRALVGSPDGRRLIRAEGAGSAGKPEALGEAVAEQLLAQGAAAILRALTGDVAGHD